MGQTDVWMDWFKLYDDLQKRSTDDLMLIYIFLSIALLEGGKFIISTAKCCLFRLTELQPVECLFSINSWQKILSFFLIPPAGALCSV